MAGDAAVIQAKARELELLVPTLIARQAARADTVLDPQSMLPCRPPALVPHDRVCSWSRPRNIIVPYQAVLMAVEVQPCIGNADRDSNRDEITQANASSSLVPEGQAAGSNDMPKAPCADYEGEAAV